MLKILLVLLMVSTLFSADWSKERKDGKLITLKTQLKGSHKGAILNFDFYKNKKLLSSSNDNKVKIWDIQEQELLKTISTSSDLKKAIFSKDGSKIYILSKHKFSVIDSSTYKELNSITDTDNNQFTSFIITNNEKKVVFSRWYTGIIAYSLINGKQLYTISNSRYGYKAELSPNQKYLAVMHSNSIKIYNSYNGEFITQLPTISGMKDIQFIDNKHLSVITNKKAYIYNYKTSELIYTATSYKNSYIKSFYKLAKTKNALIIANDKKLIRLLNLTTNKIIKKAQIDSYNSVYNGIKLSKDNSLLAIGLKNGNFKLYKTDAFLNITNIVEPQKPQKVEKIKQQNPTVIYRDKIVIKEVEKKQENKAPTLLLEASILEGVIPLKVDFTIIASDDNGISGYYINLAGKEKMSKGTPPTTLTKTFKTAGSYKVLVAVKDAQGKMTTKSLVIKPREQTFSDYKKMYQ